MLDADDLNEYINDRTMNISKTFQKKLRILNENCKNSKILFYDLGDINAVYCGLGCQLHGISASLMCAVENDMKLLVINYPQSQYENYFKFFSKNCNQAEVKKNSIGKTTSIFFSFGKNNEF